MNRKTLPGGHRLWLIGLVTLVLSLAIAVDLTPWLRGPSGPHEWRWRYQPDLISVRLVFVAVALGALGGWYWLARRRERVSGWLLATLVPIGLALQISVLATDAYGLQLVARVLNPAYYGYYPPATQIDDLSEFIDTYADAQADFDHPRMQTHPPGNVVFHWLVLRAVKSTPALVEAAAPLVEPRLAALPGWIGDYDMTGIVGGMAAGLLIPVIGTLAAIPLFLLARAAFNEETARRAALLYLLAPSLTLFEPKIDVVYTLLSSLAFLLAYLGVRGHRWWLLYLSGLLCSAGMFMSYSLLPLSLAVGLFVFAMGLSAHRQSPGAGLHRLILDLLVLALGGVSVQVAAWLLAGFDPLRAFFVMRERTARYNAVRSYWFSLVYTPYDMLLFAGIPAAALLIERIIRLARGVSRRERVQDIDRMLLGSLAAMGLMILSGVQKAENARVFLYFMPVVVLFAAAESDQTGMGCSAFLALAALTVIQLVVFQVTLMVYL